MTPRRELAGQRFHKLIVLSWAEWRHYASGRESTWLCQCDCGKQAVVPQRNLVGGNTKSCGCIVGKHKRTHGATETREFKTWVSMRQRCENERHKSYKDYGARGIKVCARWQAFANFLADMGPKPAGASLDRIDNERGYAPENCRWTDMRTQSNNRRSSLTLTINGVTKTYAQWEHDACLRPGTVSVRLNQGWQDSDVLLPSMRKGGTRTHRMRRYA